MMASKRRKISHDNQNNKCGEDDELLPGLPDHLAQLCLSAVDHAILRSVCRSWRRLIYSPSFPPFLSLYALLSDAATSAVQFHAFDPLSATWHPLPPPPPPQQQRILLRHPSFVSRDLPIRSVSAGGRLVVVAATTDNLAPALPRPLAFDPAAAAWALGPPLPAPRRWCCAASLGGAAYVAGGVGGQFSHEVARSAERWDINNNNSNSNSKWERVGELKDARFSRDAAEAVGWRGRLCMVSVRGGAARDGAVFHARSGAWEEMPPGMLAGWRGPAAAMDEEVMYAVDDAAGVLRRYDEGRDCWDHVAASESLRGAHQIAAGGGRVCAVRAAGRGIAVVDVAAAEARVWEVEVPPGLEAVAVHVLPRMSRF